MTSHATRIAAQKRLQRLENEKITQGDLVITPNGTIHARDGCQNVRRATEQREPGAGELARADTCMLCFGGHEAEAASPHYRSLVRAAQLEADGARDEQSEGWFVVIESTRSREHAEAIRSELVDDGYHDSMIDIRRELGGGGEG